MPEKIGHYTIVSELGRGGMGVVYKGHEESLNRFVAIKVLGDHLTSEPEFLSRFIREARAAAGLSHPNVIQIYFIGQDGGRHYFVMEYVSGRSVQSLIRQEGRVSNPRAAQIILQAAHGLAAAHDQGIYHRDIKPANLMLDDRGVLKIADFGLALPVEAQTRLTAAGKIMGTPGYLSPEHCLGHAVDHRADIYALGITYYEMLTGTMPFRGESPIALLRAILQDDPPDIQQLNPDVDDDSRRILEKMLAKNRDERYQDAHQLVADLEEYLAKHNVRSLTAGLANRTATTKSQRDFAASTPTALIDTAAATQRLAADAVTAKPFSLHDAPTVPGQTAVVPIASRAVTAAPVIAPAVSTKSSRGPAIAAIIAVVMLLAVGGTVAAYVGYRYFTRNHVSPRTTQAAIVAPSTGNATANAQPLLTPPGTSSAVGASATTPAQPISDTSGAAPQPPPATSTIAGSGLIAAPRTGVVQQTTAVRAATPAAPSPRLQGVAIAAVGDPGLNHAVASVLASEMAAAELKAVNGEDLPEAEGVIGDGDVSPNVLIERLRRAGVAVLVLARIKPSGQRELSYMGRHDTAYASSVSVVAYDVATGRPIERASGTVEYTQLSAEREAEKVVGPLVRRVAEAIPHR